MKFCSLVLASLALIFAGCASGSHQANPFLRIDAGRKVASESMIVWIDHPCQETKGVPFRKYHSFFLDETTGKIYGRASLGAESKEIKDKPKAGVAWESVTQFLNEKGIAAACSSEPSVASPSAPVAPAARENEQEARDDLRPVPSKFVEPVNFDLGLYYSYFTSGEGSPGAPGVAPAKPMKQKLLEFLSSPHIQAVGKADELVEKCPSALEAGEVCVKQKKHDYQEARELMFGDVDLRKNSDGSYEVFDHYCQQWKGEKEFRAVTNETKDMPGPGHIVHVRLMNCEHSWPQSKFPAPKNSAENLVQKTDLHHIFSTDTKVNAERSNWEFAEVNRASAKAMSCSDGRLGEGVALPGADAQKGSKYFEPPTAFKGNVARALFYFSSRYNAGMSPLQEAYLRKWNREDPPDDQERARHERVYRLSGVRNPFIDTPTLADSVERFCRLKLTATQAATTADCQ